MGKHKLVADKNYLPTIQETSGDWTLTAYFTLKAEDPLDAMDGPSIYLHATVRNMLVDAEGNCSADVLMDIMDQATNDGIATGTVDVMNKSEDFGDWGVRSSSVRPIFGATINNVSTGDVGDVTSASAGVKKEEQVVMIASAYVEGLGVETNEPMSLGGEVTSQDISLKTARSLLTTVVKAIQSVTLADPTVVTYRKDRVTLSGSYSNLRSSDAITVIYGSNVVAATGFGDAAHSFPTVTVTDTDHQYAAELGTLAGTRIYSIRSGDDMLSGSANIPIPSFEAQPRVFETLLMNQHGEIAGIMITQLHIPDFDMNAQVVTVSQSTVTAEQAAATAADLSISLTFNQLTKIN
jgi:hypothetical protein